jgi:hypothetical protein
MGASGAEEAAGVAKATGECASTGEAGGGNPEISKEEIGPKDGREIPERGKGPEREMGSKDGKGDPTVVTGRAGTERQDARSGKGGRSGKTIPERS